MSSVLRRHRLHRAFSLLETVVVLGLVSILALIVLPNLDLEQGASDNARAQGTLEASLDSQARVRGSAGDFADPATPDGLARLAATNPELDFVRPSDASAGPSSVSVGLGGAAAPEAVTAAVFDGDTTCWIAWRDFAAGPGLPTAVHAYFDTADFAAADCTADFVVGHLLPGADSPEPDFTLLEGLASDAAANPNGPGTSWQRPYQLR